jgi:hypothetical protein
MKPETFILKCKQETISLDRKSLEYAPKGSHAVYASLNGDPGLVSVNIDEATAGILDAHLQTWLSEAEAGKVSRPFVDFDHEGKAAAAIPTRFFWDDGLRLEVEWTKAGSEALEGRNYSYFSPEIMIDRETGQFTGLPNSGAIGSLVNTPAFQTIQRLAAASTNPKPKSQMDLEQALQKLAAAEAKSAISEKEIATLQASSAAVIIERDSAKSELETLTASNSKLSETVEAIRKEKITAAIAATSAKEESREALLKACLAQEDDGAEILAAFAAPVSTKGIPPVSKDTKPAQKTGISRLTAAISENLKAKALI